jgi:hypothetical protein
MDLTASLRELSRSIRLESGVGDNLGAIVAVALDAIPGAEFAGVSYIEERRTVTTRAATDPLVEAVDLAQYETGQGPCLTALFDEVVVSMPDRDRETRWPQFTARLAATDVLSMLSFQLFAHNDTLGALNLYAARRHAFGDDARSVGELFALHAGVVLAGAQRFEQMGQALTTRDVIGQAKGILMERFRLTGDQAFALLVQVSRTSNAKLRDVAEHLARTGELDR